MSEVEPLRALVALALVLALLASALWLLRRLGARAHAAGGHGRIAVLETRWLDPRTRLVLVRVDTSEHVVMLGAGTALLIDSRAGGAHRG